MNIADKNYIIKFLAIILVILLTVSDILFIGTNFISYALDAVDTNSEDETNEEIKNIELIMENEIQTVDKIEVLETKTTEKGLNVGMTAISGNKALQNGENIYEGQTIKYKVTITNNTGNDYTNVNVNAKQKNGYVWDWHEEERVNWYYGGEKINEHFYDLTDSNEITLGKIDSLKNGESYTYEYESSAYLLNNENIEGTQISGTLYITSDDEQLKETVEMPKNNIQKAELRAKLTTPCSLENERASEGSLESILNIENLTDTVQNNVKVQLQCSKNFNFGGEDVPLSRLFLLDDMENRVTLGEKTVNENGEGILTLIISSIEANETVKIRFAPYTSKITEAEEKAEMIAIIQPDSEKNYYSNLLERTIYKARNDVVLEQQVELLSGEQINCETDVIEDGETIKLTGIITNKDATDTERDISYSISPALEVESAKLITEDDETDITQNISQNSLKIYSKTIKANSSVKIIIVAKIVGNWAPENKVTNILREEDNKTYYIDSSTLTFLINRHEIEPIEDEEDKEITIRIEGRIEDTEDEEAPNPSSSDNQTQSGEKINQNVGVDDNNAADGEADNLNITSDNIDASKGNFDLKIQKYVSKVTVTNDAESKTYDQKDNTTLAKVEIKSKNLKESLVVIEYKIVITNVGEIDGYAKNIVDYLPSSLSFNSSLNPDWYQSGENLYNTSLANTIIKSGETKELTLVATKKMTEKNTGIINNKAKIQSSSNPLGIEDKTDDIASADVIISVSTGAIIKCITLVINILVIISTIVYLKRRKKSEL